MVCFLKKKKKNINLRAKKNVLWFIKLENVFCTAVMSQTLNLGYFIIISEEKKIPQ